MSRYIDAEWLEENAKEYSLGYYDDDEWATPLSVLDSAPSIDIVRCAECKHWSKYRTEGNQSYCEMLCGYCDGNKYCAWGERQTERSE